MLVDFEGIVNSYVGGKMWFLVSIDVVFQMP